MDAVLILEDGTVYKGKNRGSAGESWGEIVFNTAMIGYPQVFTDPSYKRQIVVMAYPLIGNYGTDENMWESNKIQVAGIVAREINRFSKHLLKWFEDENIIVIDGIDTRGLIKRIRTHGTMKAVIAAGRFSIDKLAKKVNSIPDISSLNPVPQVSVKKPIIMKQKGPTCRRAVVVDCGTKKNIINMLLDNKCEVVVVPYNFDAKSILKFKPDMVVISNGPGDPSVLRSTIQTISELIGKIPVYGICLGCQLIALALGGTTYKMKFGHRGINHPVVNLQTDELFITSQNHGFAIKSESLPEEIIITHIHLNDRTVEGIKHKKLPVEAVQFHPEAHPGPHESKKIIKKWVMESARR